MRFFVQVTLMWLLVAFVGETMISPLIDIRGIGPDFSIIALVILALATGPAPATGGGFLVGLVQDLANPNLLGLRARAKRDHQWRHLDKGHVRQCRCRHMRVVLPRIGLRNRVRRAATEEGCTLPR